MRRNGLSDERITVLVSDSSRMSCELLANALKQLTHESFIVVAAVTSSRELMAAAESNKPDIAIISTDLEDGRGTGIIALRQIHAEHPEIACVALMDDRSRHLVVDVFRAGARGLVFRTERPCRLIECVRNVHAGQVWASTAEIEEIVHALTTAVPVRAVAANGEELLTARQKQIVALVAEGLKNREIAEQLKLSEHTVKNYLFRIFDKLGVSSRAELIIYATHQQDRTA